MKSKSKNIAPADQSAETDVPAHLFLENNVQDPPNNVVLKPADGNLWDHLKAVAQAHAKAHKISQTPENEVQEPLGENVRSENDFYTIIFEEFADENTEGIFAPSLAQLEAVSARNNLPTRATDAYFAVLRLPAGFPRDLWPRSLARGSHHWSHHSWAQNPRPRHRPFHARGDPCLCRQDFQTRGGEISGKEQAPEVRREGQA